MPVKIISVRTVIGFFVLTLLVAGCTPAGPRALLKGKKYLDAGEFDAAAIQLKTATSLLATNAAAWNYYGVALQGSGHPDEAVNAYNRALELDRDLYEARLNLGMLFLEQNQADPAKTQFTACTLRRPNDPNGWLKLAAAQLKLGEIVSAERSFSAVLALKASEAEAYNGLGLARIQRNRPQEAAQFFAAALKVQPDFAPAILNLALVNQQYLHDNKVALENYEKYLALTPRPSNWDEVNTIAESLKRVSANQPTPTPVVASIPAPASAAAPVTVAPKPATPVAETRPAPKTTSAPVAVRPLLSPRAQSQLPPRPAATPTQPVAAPAPQVVQVAPSPEIVAKPGTVQKPASSETPLVVENESKPGLWHKLFGSSTNTTVKVMPLPGETAAPASKPKPTILPPSLVTYSRYQYQSPPSPVAGDRRAASAAFLRAQGAEQANRPAEALAAYQQAAKLDPSWFEAQYNAGVLAQRQGENSAALGCYEKALAIQPDSVNARYNFALTLKSAGYFVDASVELKKIIAAKPGEVRAHLTLANLCAQNLHDPAQARVHYQKVLELDPKHPQAADIRFWLAANPG